MLFDAALSCLRAHRYTDAVRCLVRMEAMEPMWSIAHVMRLPKRTERNREELAPALWARGAWLAANGMEVEDVYTVGLPNQLPTCGPADECAACEGPCAVFFSPDACTCADSRIMYRN